MQEFDSFNLLKEKYAVYLDKLFHRVSLPISWSERERPWSGLVSCLLDNYNPKEGSTVFVTLSRFLHYGLSYA